MRPNNILTYAAALCLAACASSSDAHTHPDKTPDEGYAKGADISWVTQMESEGSHLYNRAGEQRECTALMQELGANAIRLRVWVDPTDGWCGTEDVVKKALRAQHLGMRIMIDFHYSDSWADPGKQNIPKAWQELDLEGLKGAVAEHTREVLTALRNAQVDVEWVQIGNETATGMLWPIGLYQSGTENSNYAELTQAGARAAKEIYPEAKVAIHVDQGDVLGRFTYIFDYLRKEGVEYDMIAMSLYPAVEWQSQAERCIANIATLKRLYNKEVMIAEIGLEYYYPEQTKSLLEYMIHNSRDVASGIFYWEPQAAPNYNGGYNKGAFKDDRPTVALEAYLTE